MKERKRFRKESRSGPTLQDVADHAGVSTATVSRYLSNAKSVRETRRNKIAGSIAELGYIPHGAAQALASQRSRTIGAVVPTLDNAIFAKGINAFQQRLQKSGYTLFVASSEYSLEEETAQGETLMTRGVDGMMLIGSDHQERLYERLNTMRLPYVNTWVYDVAAGHPCIGFDNCDAAIRQTNYLLDIGHTRFGVITGLTQDNDRARGRLEGVLEALKQRGLRMPDALVYQSPYDIGQSRQYTRQLLAASPRPTAIVCGNDIIAFGVMLECQAQGLVIPRDISVVGFDDLPMSRHFSPSLTTMHVPSEEMGRKAAEYLLAKLNGEPAPDFTALEANLIVRGSAAPPNAV